MALHLIKLCVGCDTIEDELDWMAQNRRIHGTGWKHVHVTRMTPKRAAEILDGGSLYWVMKGDVRCREAITGLRAVTGSDGIGRCAIELSGELVPTRFQPRRPFQGWRYLEAKDAPPDLSGGEAADMPEDLRRELAALGLM
ncbi:MAG: DUF1489 domain-containing protein [Phyllobacteriaceae bacterium]|nr:DUF1489 domain-containing protein [Phyllobacteriaceae bacterium]